MHDKLTEIVKAFQVDGIVEEVVSFGSGNINDTFAVECRDESQDNKYVLQRINHSIFSDPQGLMDNILRVTSHIRTKLESQGAADIDRRVLTVIPTCDGSSCYQDGEGNYWRLYFHIKDVQSWDYLSSPDQAYEAARMFGYFQRLLVDLPDPKLNETISDFHNTPKRLQDFMEILDKDSHNRAVQVKEEIQFVLENASICDGLLGLVGKGLIPERITHNDTKINNVLFDAAEEKGICVIDLDTVMPGLSLYDFGDMVRTATCQAAEDEQDLSKIHLDVTFFEQIAKGYAQETAGFLTDAEKKHLVFAGKLITFEQMIRFLGDYLNGDVYYKIRRPEHNLDRVRTQMKLIQSILSQEDHMNDLTEKIWNQMK